jgi:predicted Zn finger-like uncharacterized protein
MRIDCDSCGAAYTIDDALIGERGIRAQCPKCGTQRVVKKDASPPAAAHPFAAPETPSPSANPFATGSAAANPFASKPNASAADPFAGMSGNPFDKAKGAAGAPPPRPLGGNNPFATATAPAPAPSPFGAPANPFAGGSAGLGGPAAPSPAAAPNPFGGAPAGAPNPFASPTAPPNPFGAPAAAPNPFASAAPSNPFAGASGATNPFGGAPAAAPNPFASAPAAAPNPFAGAPAPAPNPFASAPAAAPNPFASAPAQAPNPFASAAPASPFAGAPGTGSANPFASAPPSNPFAGTPPSNPFAGAPPTNSFAGAPAAAPFGAPAAAQKPLSSAAADPFGGATTPSSSASTNDPFESIDARTQEPDLGGESLDVGEAMSPKGSKPSRTPSEDDDPFSDIAEAPKPSRDASPAAATRWNVEARGGKSSEVSLDEVREMIRAGQIGPNDMAGPVGKPLQRIAESAILAVSLPKSAQLKSSRPAAGVRSSGGGMGRLLIGLVVVAALVGGAYVVVTSRPDLLQTKSPEGTNPFRRAQAQWSMQFPDVQGTSQEHVVEGRKFMRQDTVVGYRRADEHFRRALLVDVSNKDAIAAYVENYANLPNVSARSDPEGVALAFEGLDYVLVQDPHNAMLNRAYGALKLALGEVDEAQRYLAQATRVAPDDAEAKLLLARAQVDRDTKEALRLVELVQRQDPGLKAALVVAGAAHRRLGAFARARGFLQSRLESDPGNVPALRELARLEAALGNASASVDALRKVLENDESDVDARLMIAKLLAQSLGKPADAERELSTLLQNYSTNAGELVLPAYAHFGYLRVLRGDFDGGIEAASKALALDGSYAPAMLVVGRAKAAKGDLQGARESLEGAVRALAASRTETFFEPLARTLLADVQVRLGDTPNAIRNYNQVIEYDPRNARAYFGAAAAYMISDQPRQAVTVMRRALDVDPSIAEDLRGLTDYPTPNSDLLVYADAFKAARPGTAGAAIKDAGEGMIRLAANQDAAAEALFRKALAVDRENHIALYSLGVLQLSRNKNADALASLRRAYKGTGATHTLTNFYLARAEFASGKTADAAKRFLDVSEADQALFQAKYWHAQTLVKQGKRDEALDIFRAILTDNPDYLPVKRTLAELDVG